MAAKNKDLKYYIEQKDVEEFVLNCMPVDESVSIMPLNSSSLALDKTVITSLKDILMDNIQKIKDNKEYIPQAQAINDQAKSVIDLVKSEIDLIKALKTI